MRILVTGGSGRVGRFVVQELHDHGHAVTNLDLRRPDIAIADVPTILGDAAKMEDAFGALSYARAEALVHMAAWSDPGFVADSRTFGDNVRATFNLLDVCARTGIDRAIIASSAQVYGFAEHGPVYAPVDEDHPLRPLNSYALSKICGEQAAAYFAARHAMRVATFRIMGARAPGDLDEEIATLRTASPGVGRFLLWNRTDARDVARACRLALEAPVMPSGVYNITARQNAVGIDSAELLRRHCPDTEIRGELTGSTSILSSRKARDDFGYEAQFR
jgi:nucleoside-diphosphate-sugar epimerase